MSKSANRDKKNLNRKQTEEYYDVMTQQTSYAEIVDDDVKKRRKRTKKAKKVHDDSAESIATASSTEDEFDDDESEYEEAFEEFEEYQEYEDEPTEASSTVPDTQPAPATSAETAPAEAATATAASPALVSSVSAKTKHLLNQPNPRWKDVLRLPVTLQSDGRAGTGDVLLLSQLQADGVPDMDESKGSGSSDPYVQVTLVRGDDDQFTMEIHLWDKDWHADDQPIANGSVKVPSPSSTKEGKFSVELICITSELPKVPFRCDFRWTVSAGGHMVTTKRVVKRRKKNAKAKTSGGGSE